MNLRKRRAISEKSNLYLNVFNLILFVGVAASGSLLQIPYHMHGLPDAALVLGLDKAGWIGLHKGSAILFLAGIVVHCLLNWAYLWGGTKRIFSGKFSAFKSHSYWVFAIGFFTCLTALVPWLIFGAQDPGRFILIESHDKLGWIFMLVTGVHIVLRAGKMTKAYRGI